ncbi:hypothetical protein [Amycolatopsis sp. cg9]|uniref:hypothetical protein n=1 Tax=Amycolatopsis sp. cg9 TaxID=3238801 RepID=UPI00352637AC
MDPAGSGSPACGAGRFSDSSAPNPTRRQGIRAFAVLRYLGWLLLVSGGAFYAYVKLHELGVI